MNRTRSWRRFQYEKTKKKAKNSYCYCGMLESLHKKWIKETYPETPICMINYEHLSEKDLEMIQGSWAKTRKLCSSYCCGNPRKWFKQKTLQEIKFEEGIEDKCE